MLTRTCGWGPQLFLPHVLLPAGSLKTVQPEDHEVPDTLIMLLGAFVSGTLAILSSGDALAVASLEFRVCGNYCGPGYCGGERLFAGSCNYSMAPDSCADSCCMAHDKCCSEGDDSVDRASLAGCNSVFLSCA